MFKDPPKNNLWFNNKIEVRKSSLHGMGVFATEAIDAHESIECVPVLLFHRDTMKNLRVQTKNYYQTHVLHDYVFGWEKGLIAIAWGYGSIYNHGEKDANVSYKMRLHVPSIEFITKRKIEAGEELLIHYRCGKAAVEFDPHGGKI